MQLKPIGYSLLKGNSMKYRLKGARPQRGLYRKVVSAGLQGKAFLQAEEGRIALEYCAAARVQKVPENSKDRLLHSPLPRRH